MRPDENLTPHPPLRNHSEGELNTPLREDGEVLGVRFFERIGLLGAAFISFDTAILAWRQGPVFVYPLSALLSLAAWIVGIAASILALNTPFHRRWSWLMLVSMIGFGCTFALVNVQDAAPLTLPRADNEMIGRYALAALKSGQNPYSWNFSDMVRVFGNVGDERTPLLDGSYQNRLTYPALSVVLLWLFDRIGLGEARTIDLIFYIALISLIFVGTPDRFRPVILLPLAALKMLTPLALSGVQDVVWSALLVAMLLNWRRPILRAVLFGLAISFRQQPWFIAPFLLIALWHAPGTARDRLRRAAIFLAISGGLFVLINLPFALNDWEGWRLGAFEPAYAAFNVYSFGFGALSTTGIAPFPRTFYTIIQLSLLGGAIYLYARHPRAIGHLIWLVPPLFFWLYYRGLPNYWLFWIPPLLAAIVLPRGTDGRGLPRPYPMPIVVGTRPAASAIYPAASVTSVIIVALILIGDLGLAAHYLSLPPAITLTYAPPLLTVNYAQIGQLDVRVGNHSGRLFKPRFAVQWEPNNQALPWTILNGPESLAPGESAVYTISANEVPTKAIPIKQAAQVVVSDADGDYERRALATILPDTTPSRVDFDQIDNADFRYWPLDWDVPQSWLLQPTAYVEAHTTFDSSAPQAALTLTLDNPTLDRPPADDPHELTPIRLTQTITFPARFSIWVNPSEVMTEPLHEAYGVEIDDGAHHLWIVFGGALHTIDHLAIDASAYTVVYLPAPLDTWSLQPIDLAGLYTQIGWTLPNPSPRLRYGVHYQAIQVRLSLIGTSNTRIESIWHFGAIVSDPATADFDRMIGAALDQMLITPTARPPGK